MRLLRALRIVGAMVLGVLVLSGLALAHESSSSATNADDELIGDKSKDQISGLAGADYIEGKGGADVLSGGDGHDEILGNSGNDQLDGGMDPDELFGGGGNDTIMAADGSEDYVNCGTGTEDTASVDETDIVNKNCETSTPSVIAQPTTSTATATATAQPTASATATATADFSVVDPQRMMCTYGPAQGFLFNHSYMHGMCGSVSTQYAVRY